jgi:hypothetical protein
MDLKSDVAEARALMQEGRKLEALEILERVYPQAEFWQREEIKVTGERDPELDEILNVARRLAGQIRGDIASLVLKGPSLGGGFFMGLHTQEERAKAYEKAKEKVEWALRQGNPLAIANGLGYLEAMMDLAEDESSDDESLIRNLQDLYYRLADAA